MGLCLSLSQISRVAKVSRCLMNLASRCRARDPLHNAYIVAGLISTTDIHNLTSVHKTLKPIYSPAMFSQRVFLRASQRYVGQLRSPLQRRFASHQPELHGLQDNAFNRERAAVKAHATASSGSSSTTLPLLAPRQVVWA